MKGGSVPIRVCFALFLAKSCLASFCFIIVSLTKLVLYSTFSLGEKNHIFIKRLISIMLNSITIRYFFTSFACDDELVYYGLKNQIHNG